MGPKWCQAHGGLPATGGVCLQEREAVEAMLEAVGGGEAGAH